MHTGARGSFDGTFPATSAELNEMLASLIDQNKERVSDNGDTSFLPWLLYLQSGLEALKLATVGGMDTDNRIKVEILHERIFATASDNAR